MFDLGPFASLTTNFGKKFVMRIDKKTKSGGRARFVDTIRHNLSVNVNVNWKLREYS